MPNKCSQGMVAEETVMNENSDQKMERIKAVVAKEKELIDKYGADVFDGYDGASGKAPITVKGPEMSEPEKQWAAKVAKRKASA
jgi:hypothetical protein